MPERLTQEQWQALLTDEDDPFRLTIRAWAAIEAEIDAQCERLLRVPMKDGMQSLGPIAKRISVASALGVVPAQLAPSLKVLGKLRHDFAHGDLDELDDERADRLLRRLRDDDVLPPDLYDEVKPEAPVHKLETALVFIMGFIKAAGDAMHEWRRKTEFALVAQTPEGRRLLDEYRRRREQHADD